MPILCSRLAFAALTFANVFGHRRQDESKALRWYMATAYGLPLIEVLVAYFAWPAAYDRDDGVCFLAKKNNAMWLFVGPVLVVIVLNIYVLVKISRVIYDMPAVSPRDSTTSETIGRAKRAFKSALMFGSIMGITWLLGLLSFFAGSELAFHYTFAVFNALGGVWIFGFHLVMDPEVKKKYVVPFFPFSCGCFLSLALETCFLYFVLARFSILHATRDLTHYQNSSGDRVQGAKIHHQYPAYEASKSRRHSKVHLSSTLVFDLMPVCVLDEEGFKH